MSGEETTTAAATDPFAGSEDYLARRSAASFRDLDRELDVYLARLASVVDVPPRARVLEVGVGTGWLLVAAARRGFRCRGIEHNPYNAAHARDLAGEHGVSVDVLVSSIEDAALEPGTADIVFALSVFEHVRDVDAGLRNVHRALAPGGALYFYSTNKWAPRSGEYAFPLYGWLPQPVRRRLRVARQGQRIVDSAGFDFNQFTYWGLRRRLRRVGFSRVIDQFDLLEGGQLAQPTAWKRTLAVTLQRSAPLRAVARVFASGTCFVCVK